MNKDVIEQKVVAGFVPILGEISSYFGETNKDKINENAKRIKLSVVKDNRYVSMGEEKIYVGDEPVCIKDGERVNIIIPLSVMYDARGNVMVVHSLLHGLSDEIFSEEDSVLDEIVVDFMANDISKRLQTKGINVTMCQEPIYESNSFYSNMFNEIAAFYEKNKKNILDGKMSGNIYFEDDEEVKEISKIAKEAIEGVFEKHTDEAGYSVKKGK